MKSSPKVPLFSIASPQWIWPFIAGALSASLIWSVGDLKWRRKSSYSLRHLSARFKEDEEEVSDDESDISDSDDEERNIANRPSYRWPWDTIRNKVITASASFLNIEIDEDTSTDTGASAYNTTSKTGPCIGAIFGLDVGGTLTKLVYFEQQINEYKRRESYEDGLHRRDHYHAAASATEVLQARRSNSTVMTRHNTDSEDDLRGLWDMRQESVPDRLDEFANSCNLSPLEKSLSQNDERIINDKWNSHGGESFSQSRHYSNAGGTGKQNIKPEGGMGLKKKSVSMVNLSTSTEHAEALDNFYSFARRLDTYETAVKDKHLSYYSRFLNGQFHFIRFETRRMKNAMNLLRINDAHLNIKEIGSTGGGSHKFANDWERELGITMKKQDEMDSLVAGMQFVMSDIVGECYTFKPNEWNPTKSALRHNGESSSPVVNGSLLRTPNRVSTEKVSFSDTDIKSMALPNLSTESTVESDNDSNATPDNKQPLHQEIDKSNSLEDPLPPVDQWWASKKVQRDTVLDRNAYPYLLVSIGTGVSILRVDGPRKHERISGSTIGGGTYWGLCRLLTGSDSFSDVLNLAMKGDPSKVDMMVGDIYGKNSDALEKIGLPSNIVASSFGKLVAKQNPSEGIKEEDLARALLLMVTNNIGQVAHLNAQLHKISQIYFVGTFLQHNTISQQRLAHAIDYWSRGKTEALFLEHEGYFGALGAFLLNQGIAHDGKKPGISENGKDVDLKRKKRRSSRLHRRSKSMGCIPSQT